MSTDIPTAALALNSGVTVPVAAGAVELSPRDLYDKMVEFEQAIGQMPGAKFGDDCCPLEHSFADGMYIRKMTAPRGMINVSKLHKTNHPFFILEGSVSILTETGIIRITAPHFGITKAGTKRVVYFHEDTVWITCHATKETDLEKIEDEVIAKTFDELPERTEL